MLKQVVLLICCFSVAASAQLVSNQSFEIGNVSDSSIAENWTSNSGISRTNETLPHSGDYCLKLEEGTDWLNASQVPDFGDGANLGGSLLKIKAFAKYTESTYTQEAILKIVFYDNSETYITHKELMVLSNSDPIDTWVESEFFAAIPSGTRYVEIQVMTTGYNQGAVYFDDVTIERVENLLCNGSFELEDSGESSNAAYWVEPDLGEGLRKDVFNKTGQWCFNIADLSGTPGNPAYPNVRQTIDMGRDISGKEFTFSIYAMHTDYYERPLVAGNSGVIKIEFLQADGTYISSVDNWFFDSNQPVDQWIYGEVTGTAPVGAQQIQVQAMLISVGGEGEIFFDDATVKKVENLLCNGSFELEDSGESSNAAYWVEPDFGEGLRKDVFNKTGQWCFNIADLSGTPGDPAYPNVRQTIDMGRDISGKEFTFSIYAMHTDYYERPLVAGNSGVIKIEFLQADGTYISSVDNWFFDSNQPVDQWIYGEVTGTAPVGAQQIQIQAMLISVGGDGEIFFDDAVLANSSFPMERKVLDWSFEEIVAGIIKDNTGLNHGHVVQEPNIVEGLVGNCVQLDGSGQCVEGYIPLLMMNTEDSDWTMNMYVCPASSEPSCWAIVGGFGLTDNLMGLYSAENWVMIRINDESYQYTFWNWGEEIGLGTEFLAPSKWQMVTVVKEGNFIKVYRDGVFYSSMQMASVDNCVQRVGVGSKAPYATTSFKGKIDEFNIWNYALNQTEIDALSAVVSVVNPDLDNSGDVGISDLEIMAANWLLDSHNSIQPDIVLDDFEAYGASDPNISDGWAKFDSPGGAVIELLETGAYSGSQAMRFSYDVTSTATEWSDIYLTFQEPVDLSQYDSLRLAVNRQAGNSHERLFYVKFFNNRLTDESISAEKWVLYEQGSTASPVGWNLWEIDLKGPFDYWRNGYGAIGQLDNVVGLMIGLVNGDLDDYPEAQGTGVIDIDEIVLVDDTPDCDTVLLGDLNENCEIDLEDFAILAEYWQVD